ncbi:hypothetical protein BGW80DRAFT_1250167 [Lactifluus volemus]|nr:hypothetical protein BGW80DRAFT_1250167 [Lactifluus volemus]
MTKRQMGALAFHVDTKCHEAWTAHECLGLIKMGKCAALRVAEREAAVVSFQAEFATTKADFQAMQEVVEYSKEEVACELQFIPLGFERKCYSWGDGRRLAPVTVRPSRGVTVSGNSNGSEKLKKVISVSKARQKREQMKQDGPEKQQQSGGDEIKLGDEVRVRDFRPDDLEGCIDPVARLISPLAFNTLRCTIVVTLLLKVWQRTRMVTGHSGQASYGGGGEQEAVHIHIGEGEEIGIVH